MSEQLQTPAPTNDADGSVGRKLRLRRSIRGLSLQEVADKAEISVSLLSQIERGVATPSLRSLRLICAALNMPVGWLFDVPDVPHDDIIVRSSARRLLNLMGNGMTKEMLSPDTVPGIQMLRIVIQPDGNSGQEPYNNESGSKCGVVLSGKLGLDVEGREHILEPGDSFAFAATKLHRFWCAGDQQVEVIWVVTPAIY
ncbi:helix-turn-helix domain-containing protein [Rhizobium leguminosarum]|uniref:helix-turn-helix domain-containing protein n=1 Tax=Rhizobium leguminosarum TaxID=384 RepID=UPI001C96CD07|nr:XRE family transcriptional regulator [Rhizobium leguminosarum]MBY5533709.1 helix-turn-helix domain-containing protein [Rhizobium leguminosarum]